MRQEAATNRFSGGDSSTEPPISRSRRVTYALEQGLRAASEIDTQRITRWAEIFEDLTRIPSKTGMNMEPILSYIKGFYNDLGVRYQKAKIHAEIIGENEAMVVTIGGEESNRALDTRKPRFLAAHVDTVGATDTQPFIDVSDGIPTYRSAGQTGLGGDDKAAIAEILVATEEVIACGQDHFPLVIGFTSDEEGASAAISKIPTYGADIGLILDREGDPLTRGIVVGAYGYHRFQVDIPDLQGMRALEFVTRFSEQIGSRLVGRRTFPEPLVFPEDVSITINEFSLHKSAIEESVTRNAVPSYANLVGSVAFSDSSHAQEALKVLGERAGGEVSTLEIREGEIDFQIDFFGVGGHPSRDDLETPLSNLEIAGRALVGGQSETPMPVGRRGARYSVADVTVDTGVHVIGEVRYAAEAQDDTDKTLVLLQNLVREYGGEMTYAQENRPYRLPDDHPAVQLGDKILADVAQEEGFESVNLEHIISQGASDANNAKLPIIVVSEGTEEAHTQRENVPVHRALSAMGVVRRFCTQG